MRSLATPWRALHLDALTTVAARKQDWSTACVGRGTRWTRITPREYLGRDVGGVISEYAYGGELEMSVGVASRWQRYV